MSDAPRIQSRTMCDLKKRLRAEMGWKDRRSWSAEEMAAVLKAFAVGVDHDKGVFYAVKRTKGDEQ